MEQVYKSNSGMFPRFFLAKVHLHTAINQDDSVSWCMLYTYETKVTKCICEKMTIE